MELKFELDKEDLLKFNRFHHWFSPHKKKQRLRTRLSFAFPFLIMPYVLSNNNITINTTYGINMMIICCALGLCAWFMAKTFTLESIERRLNNFLKNGKNQDLLGEHTMIFGDDEVEIITPNTNTKISISTIEIILEDDEYYYIYINMLSAYIIPKNALKNNFESDKLVEILNNYITVNSLT